MLWIVTQIASGCITSFSECVMASGLAWKVSLPAGPQWAIHHLRQSWPLQLVIS